jgi:type I restriction enzyme S subunit
MKEWKKYKLGEILTVKYGKDHKKLDAGSIPVYGSGGLMRFVNSYICDSPSILIPRKGSLNNVMYVEHPFWTVDTMFWTIIDTTIAVPRFVYYAICKIDFESLNVGSAVPSMTVPIIEDIEIFLPSLDEQKRIVKVLSSLESKIELNHQINDNLEQQAQALYKSWFVDFEPFCEEEFIETSIGSIPAGWKVGQLSDICEIVGGGTPSKSHPEYYCRRGIAWITPKDLSVSKSKFSSRGSEDITSDGYKNSSAKLMPRGTVLFSSRAPIGYISIATNEICTNQGFKSAVPGIAGTGYLYYFLQANTDKIESKASGSTFKEASGSLMKALEVIIPADGIFNQFEAELAPILNKQENIASEIQTLTTLRDTILPKLMSGELKINEIDC